MATHSSILAWRIPWTVEPDRLESVGSQELDTTEWLTLSLSSQHPLTSFHWMTTWSQSSKEKKKKRLFLGHPLCSIITPEEEKSVCRHGQLFLPLCPCSCCPNPPVSPLLRDLPAFGSILMSCFCSSDESCYMLFLSDSGSWYRSHDTPSQ